MTDRFFESGHGSSSDSTHLFDDLQPAGDENVDASMIADATADTLADLDDDPPTLGLNANLLRAAPGLAMVGATTWWHLTSWSVKATVSASTYVTRRALDGEPAGEILASAATDLRGVALRALGIDNSRSDRPDLALSSPASIKELQAGGAALLWRSANLQASDAEHPAYARILTELAPDEARILRFLALNGAQPSLDIRTGRPLGIGSQLIAAGLNMIAEHAGCRDSERIHPYLTNLNRLGLVNFSKEEVDDPARYQLVESQPHIAQLIKKGGFGAKIIHRRIQLTRFGEDFCELCLTNHQPSNND